MRDPHAEFRRGSRLPLVLGAAAVAAAVGGFFYVSSQRKPEPAATTATAEPKTRAVIGASVNPERVDASEVVPGAAPGPLVLTPQKPAAPEEPATPPPATGSSKEFANMFKAAAQK